MSPTMIPRHLSARAPRARSPEARLLEPSPRETPAGRGAVPRGRRGREGFGFRGRPGWRSMHGVAARPPPLEAGPRETPVGRGAVPRGRRGREGFGFRDVRAGDRWTVWPRGRDCSRRARARRRWRAERSHVGGGAVRGTPDGSDVASLELVVTSAACALRHRAARSPSRGTSCPCRGRPWRRTPLGGRSR